MRTTINHFPQFRGGTMLLLLLAFATGCTHSPSEEEQGQQMLNMARTAYVNSDYSTARDSIMSLRKRFPLALEARRQAILLLDSIEIMAAQGDTLKEAFYRRKLDHDRQELKIEY